MLGSVGHLTTEKLILRSQKKKQTLSKCLTTQFKFFDECVPDAWVLNAAASEDNDESLKMEG